MKKKGGGKAKGAGFEREVCKYLSRWVSRGRREDLYWRSAMSGGRATLGHKKGKDLAHQAGDICAVHPEGHALTNYWYIECKTYRNLRFEFFLLNASGPLKKFWRTTVREAKKYDRQPMMICRHRSQTFVLIPADEINRYDWAKSSCLALIMTPNVAVLSFAKMLVFLFSRMVRIRA